MVFLLQKMGAQASMAEGVANLSSLKRGVTFHAQLEQTIVVIISFPQITTFSAEKGLRGSIYGVDRGYKGRFSACQAAFGAPQTIT